MDGVPAVITTDRGVQFTSAVWQVDRNRLASKSRNTPFHQMNLSAVVKRTFFNGLQVFNDGEVLNRGGK